MAARSEWAAFLRIFLLLCLILELCAAQRYGSPGKYITLARRKRTEPETIEAPVTTSGRRVRRDASDSVKNQHSPNATAVHTKDRHQQVMIQWAGEGSDVIVCVTRDAQQTNTSVSHVFISENYGASYKNRTNNFKTVDGKPAIINKFYKNDMFTSRFVFTDIIHKYIHVTQDYGLTIISRKVDFAPTEISHHPFNADVLLAHDTEDPIRKLWLSENFGEDWRIIGLYVKSYFWSEYTTPPTLYVERGEPDQLSTVLSSQYLFREDLTPRIVISEVEEFEVQDEFLFVVRRSMTSDALYLTISYKGGFFLTAEFPNELKHEHYYIADISEGQVMVCVAHEHFWSNLYVSSVPRSSQHPVKFSLSLERIFFFKPSAAWDNTWLSGVALKKFADLHAVEGVRGVFIASQLQQVVNSSTTLRPEHLTSIISFDQGARWKPVQPPKRDVDGVEINCIRTDGCSLHVSQEFSHLYPSTDTTQILSRKSAPGLIMATGTVGKSLKGHTSLYISRDAGINWFQVLKGNYLYTFGDHGGVMVAVQPFGAGGEVKELLYSIDEGETWLAFDFSDQKMRVYGLMTEPGENTTIFTIFGSMPEEHQWIFVKVNMTAVFQYEKCTSDDYKTWSPSDGRSGRLCLLGRNQTYERRMPHANCYNGQNYDRPISVLNCPCDREDFECDYGFIVDEVSEKCIQDPKDIIDPYAIPRSCRPGSFYNRTKGYRLIPGDTCEAGRGYQYAPSITACPVHEDQEFLLVSARQEILRYDLVNPESGLQSLPIPGLKMVIALDFDLKNNCIYWSDVDEKKIYRLCFDGLHDVETLLDRDLRSVEGLAFDWISKNLYFVDGERKTLEVIRADISHSGRMRRTLLHDVLDNPRGIALHPVRGYLYITDWSESSPKVARAFLDGTKFTVLFGEGIVGWPNGITIDFQTERIFFADAKLDYIASADLDGRNMRKIISNSEVVIQPFAVGIYKSTLFWDDWTVYKVLQADKENGWGVTPIGNFTRKGLVDLKVFGHWSQQNNNSCGYQQPNCQYLCMARPDNQFTCLCPDGLRRKEGSVPLECLCPDGTAVGPNGTCAAANNTCAPKYFLCNTGRCVPEQWLCDKDNDCGDNSDETVERCVQQGCEMPSWQCKNRRCISPSLRCDHQNNCGDGSDEEDCTYQPCPNNSFPCNNGRCVHRNWVCDMEDDCRDGSDELHCNTTESTKCRASEFTCTSNSRCLPGAWRCDGETDCFDGSDEEECVRYSCEAWQFACNTTKQCIFSSWRCDGESDCADSSDEWNCTVTTPVPPPPTVPQRNCSELMFRCDNGHCVPFWWRCDRLDDCGDWSDEDSCSYPNHRPNNTTTTIHPPTTPVMHTCQKDQFQCRSGSCIWETWVCDRDRDCPEGEDEENCHQTTSCHHLSEFQCRRSGGCVPSDRICDDHQDCADGSDEEGCGSLSTVVSSCPSGFFMCDGGACQDAYKLCDGDHDCVDLSDEQNCSSSSNRSYAVVSFSVLREGNTTAILSWKVNNETDLPPSNLEYQPSLVQKVSHGNPGAWKNFTWTSNTTYEFSDLQPYTLYVLKIYIREENGSTIYPPVQSMVFHTQQGVPDPPFNVKVKQVLDKVRVTWQPPFQPNGLITEYHVYVTPPIPARITTLPVDVNQLMIPPLHIKENITVWVTVTNDRYTSRPSESVNFSMVIVDKELKVQLANTSNSSITLSWDAIEGVEGYTVSHDQPENEYLMGKVFVNTTKPTIEVKGLAPGLEYSLEVRAYKGEMLGQSNTVRAKTQGQKLKAVQALQAALTSDLATTIKLSWTKPAYKGQKKVSWRYRVVWGMSDSELKHGLNSGTTTNTTFTIPRLEACVQYLLAVMVDAPLGIGPVSNKRRQTGTDPLAPPKKLKVQMENSTMKVSWDASCQQDVNSSLNYLVKVVDTIKQRSWTKQLIGGGNLTLTLSLAVHWGAEYEVTVSAALPGSRPTNPPATINGPVIPPPIELTYNYFDDTFHWSRNRSLPVHILQQNFSYVLYISENMNMSEVVNHDCTRPPTKVPDLGYGIVYYSQVALKDVDGYLSPRSNLIRFEKLIGDQLVVSQGSVVGVGVSVFLVVTFLVAVVVALAVRHRRLARSFLTFANTHYDRSQGTTLITTNDHSLDEDDDSPMIRGFSDDEPLVIA